MKHSLNSVRRKIRRLVVKRADDSIVGILTIDDIFDASYTNFLFFIQNIENAETVIKISQYRDSAINSYKKPD
jgi:signal-transduction protein with cAMP-binding, CBS, and nucleotidyltransferase domain